MNNLASLRKAAEKLTKLACVTGGIEIRPEGPAIHMYGEIKCSKARHELHRMLSWEEFETARIDVLDHWIEHMHTSILITLLEQC